MNFRHLEVFRAVMDTGSATAAARLLHLSQPAVSRQLRQLETAVGIDLFIRRERKLLPTAHATALYREAAQAFEGMERIINATQKLRAHNFGVLRIAAPYSFCEDLLPRIIARLVRSHADLRYTVDIGPYERIASMIAMREVDVGILKDPIEHFGVSKIRLVDSRMVCAIAHGHKLARRGTLSIADIAEEPLILLGQRQVGREELQSLFRRSGKTPIVRLETHAVGAACGFAANGLGVAVLPELLAAQFVSRGVVLHPLSVEIPQRFSLGVAEGTQSAELMTEFAGAARKIVRELLLQMRDAKRG